MSPNKTLWQNSPLLYWVGDHPNLYVLSAGDTILTADGCASLLVHNLQYHLPKSIIAAITNREGVEQITESVFHAIESA